MTAEYHGSFIRISFIANELPADDHTSVELPDGYSYERIFIHQLFNIIELLPYQTVNKGDRITFPPINCQSPSKLFLSVKDTTKPADIRLSIEKFGQIPNPNYFDDTFKPIIVTGEDGNKYNVIPSDQFK